MRVSWAAVSALAGILATSGAALAQRKTSAPAGEPRTISIFPFTGPRGGTFTATVRGSSLLKATAVYLDKAPFKATIEGAEAEPPPSDGNPRNRTAMDLVRLRIEVPADAKPGSYPFRLVTPQGISNALPIRISEHAISAEPEGAHEGPETAVLVERLPSVMTGRILRRGEADYYAVEGKAGETVTFTAYSGLPSPGAAGSAAAGFDPALTLFAPSGSWFDPKRLNRLAYNDEPLWVIGRPTDAQLSYKFEKTGRYYLRIEAFSGQAGPDYGYELNVLPGEPPPETPVRSTAERAFPRALTGNRLNELAERGGKPKNQTSVETYLAKPVPAAEAPMFKIPGTLEGSLNEPRQTDRARFHVDGPVDIAIEIETPDLAPPLFNPFVRLLNAAGEEVVTSVLATRGACSGALGKSLQAKTTMPLRDAGDYTIEIRETTADLGGPRFRYRVQVRPQIPHIGQVTIDVDHLNLIPGDAKTVRVTFDREEGYRGAIAVAAEMLPPGVQAMAAADFEEDRDAPIFASKRERYTGVTERTVVAFSAAPDAAASEQPQIVRLVARPIVDGKPGAVIASKQFPMMVTAKPVMVTPNP